MSIRLKTLFAIIAASLVLFVVLMMLSFNVILKEFDRIEMDSVNRNIARATDALNAKIDETASKLSDWSQWDDSYQYVQDQTKNKSFVTSNLTNEAFTALKINMIVFIDTKGTVVFSKFVNLATGEEEPLPPGIEPYLQNGSLTQHQSAKSVIKGIINLPSQDMLIASRPILNSRGEGPIKGTLIFGRFLDDEIKTSVADLTHLDLSFFDMDVEQSPEVEQAEQEVMKDKVTIVQPINEDTTIAYFNFNDIFNKPITLIRMDQDREIHKQGVKSVYTFLLFDGILSLSFAILTLLLLEKLVLSRVFYLSSQVKNIGEKEETTARVKMPGKDELTMLALEINQMLDILQESSEKIKEGEEKIKEEAMKLEEKNATLEKSEHTLLRVMSDLEETKDHIEKEKIQDETMLESIGEGLIVTDKNGIALIVNNSAQQMLKFTAQELVGKRLSDYIVMTDESGTKIPSEETILAKVLNTGQKLTNNYVFVRKDGTSFPGVITTTAINTNSTNIGVISVIRDVTKEKEVDRMKTEFISLASHQLRTPLTAIKWFIESLLGQPEVLQPHVLEYLRDIYNSNERMIDLVDSLLNISRIESGRLSVRPKSTNLSEVVMGVKKELEVKFQKKNITFQIQINPDVPTVITDPKLLSNVYLNLISNAVKYSPENTTVTLQISKQDDSVVSQITDMGYGIPVGQQERLFQKFFRAENILTKETDGTGLGLYLVKVVLDLLEGKIWFKSAENQGSTFWFSIPVSGIKPKEGEVSLS